MLKHTRRVGVNILLIKDNKILLARRTNTHWADGMLGIPGGHLEEGESARQAAVREIEEELGLHIAQDRLVAYSTVFMRTNYEYVIQEFYVELFEIENPVNKETDKCSELVWCAPDNLPADVQDIFEVIIQQGFISGERYLEIGY